jgi:hypothetical protein
MGFSQFDNFRGFEVLFRGSYRPLSICHDSVGSLHFFGRMCDAGLMHVTLTFGRIEKTYNMWESSLN